MNKMEKSLRKKYPDIVTGIIVFMSGDACIRASFNGQSDFYSLQELSFTQEGGNA